MEFRASRRTHSTFKKAARYERISAPKKRRSLSRLRTFMTPKRIIATLVLLMVAWALVGRFIPKPAGESQKQPTASQTNSPTSSAPNTPLTKGTPDYTTVLPAGKTIESLGGWTRVSPPNGNAVYAYVDTVGKATLTVSQQPLPDNFKDDTNAEIDQLAAGYNATQKLTVQGTVVHIGTSVKGPQSVIFTKNKVLVLIKTNIPLDNDQWSAYISQLR